MSIFNKTWYWKLELAPMYMNVMAKPLTARQQEFRVLCGLTSTKTYEGKRLPQVGELLTLPGLARKGTVSTIRVQRFGSDEMNRKDFPAIVYFDSKQIGGDEFWNLGLGQMRPVREWQWSADFYPDNYEIFGHTPSDWANPKLKFKERDYVLSWKKSGSEMLTPEGDFVSRFDDKHKYLFDWFPEVKSHVESMSSLFGH